MRANSCLRRRGGRGDVRAFRPPPSRRSGHTFATTKVDGTEGVYIFR